MNAEERAEFVDRCQYVGRRLRKVNRERTDLLDERRALTEQGMSTEEFTARELAKMFGVTQGALEQVMYQHRKRARQVEVAVAEVTPDTA